MIVKSHILQKKWTSPVYNLDDSMIKFGQNMVKNRAIMKIGIGRFDAIIVIMSIIESRQ